MAKEIKDIIAYINLIPPFDGDKSSLPQFIFQVEGMSALVDATLQTTFLKLLVNTKITGKALESVRNKIINSWLELKTILSEQCNVKSTNWHMRLMNENQRLNESVSEFGKRLNNIFEECINPGSTLAPDDIVAVRASNEEFLLLCYRRGLVSDEIRDCLTKSSITTITKAIELAQTIENNLNSNKLLSQSSLLHINSRNPKHCAICNKNNHSTKECHYNYYETRTNFCRKQNYTQPTNNQGPNSSNTFPFSQHTNFSNNPNRSNNSNRFHQNQPRSTNSRFPENQPMSNSRSYQNQPMSSNSRFHQNQSNMSSNSRSYQNQPNISSNSRFHQNQPMPSNSSFRSNPRSWNRTTDNTTNHSNVFYASTQPGNLYFPYPYPYQWHNFSDNIPQPPTSSETQINNNQNQEN